MCFLQAKAYGPGVSGALFGAGWWFWVDACASSAIKVPFVQASLADIHACDSFDAAVIANGITS